MKKIVRIGAIALIAFAAIGVMSCDVMLTLMASPTVSVIDARTGSGINGVTVTLTPIAVEEDQTPQMITGLSGSSGSVVFTSTVPYGTYSVSGTLAGYVFIPFEATIAGWSESLGKMFGVSTNKGNDPNAVSIFLTWADNTNDIDAHFSYPSGFDTSLAARGAWTATNAYYDFDEARIIVKHNNKQTTSEYASLDVDDTSGEGPETITLLGSQTGSVLSGSTFTVSSSTPYLGSVLTAGNYYWMGAGEYYLDAYTTGTSLDTQDVRVVVTQGSSIKGIFTLPSNMTQETISLFRVQMFYSADQNEYFMVFMPDLRLVDGTAGIKSIEGIPEDSVIVVSGTK